MWTTITHESIQRAEGELTHSHFQMDLRHAEELEALDKRHEQERNDLDARLAKIEEIERSIEAFAREYLPNCRGGTARTGGTEPSTCRSRGRGNLGENQIRVKGGSLGSPWPVVRTSHSRSSRPFRLIAGESASRARRPRRCRTGLRADHQGTAREALIAVLRTSRGKHARRS